MSTASGGPLVDSARGARGSPADIGRTDGWGWSAHVDDLVADIEPASDLRDGHTGYRELENDVAAGSIRGLADNEPTVDDGEQRVHGHVPEHSEATG